MASIPRANAPISNNDGSPTREWYNYLRANLSPSDLTTVEGEITVIAEKLGSPDGTVQNIPPISVGGTIVAQQSVAAVGAFPGAVILNLVNDQASPGNTYFYGTSPTGSKGWVSLTTALGQASIGNLGDVDTTTTAPTDGQVLTWVNADSKWEPRTPTGGSLPPGGSTGQVLTKLSATDGDADWEDQGGGGITPDAWVNTYVDLPTPPPSGKNTYGVLGDGLIYGWNGSAWPADGSGLSVGVRVLESGAIPTGSPYSPAIPLAGLKQLTASLIGVTLAASGWRYLDFSWDGGTSWCTSWILGGIPSGSYWGTTDTNGVFVSSTASIHSTASSAARYAFSQIAMSADGRTITYTSPNKAQPAIVIRLPSRVTHFRIAGHTGSAYTNITGGDLEVQGM